MNRERKQLAKLLFRLKKYNLEQDYLSHREHTSHAFGSATDQHVTAMSSIKKTFTRYVEVEDKSRKLQSAKYRWKIEKFRKDHRDLFGDDTDLNLSKLEQMIVALKDEYEAAKEDVQRNSHKIEKIEGRRLGINDQVYACYLTLNADDIPNFKEGVPCNIRAGKKELAQAEIVDYDDKEQCVYLSSNSDLTKLTSNNLRLVVDLSWLIQALIDKLKSKTSSFLKQGPLKGFLEGNIQQQEVKFTDAYYTGKLNDSQKRAVKTSLKKDVTLIWGPPGTGKSYTLAHVILTLSRSSGKTVVTCISNDALDSLIKAFLKVYKTYYKNSPSAVLQDNFVRLGVSRSPDVLESKLFYPEDDQLESHKSRLRQIRKRLDIEMNRDEVLRLKSELQRIYKWIKQHNQKRIDNAKVIFSTAAQFTVLTSDNEQSENAPSQNIGIDLKHTDFNNIILDEVSMMYPPQFVGLCQSIKKRIIAAGDFRQLGPIHLSSTAMAIIWLKQDVFEFARILDTRRNVRQSNYFVQLLEQFRSHEKICKLINQPFYENQLVTRYERDKNTDYGGFKPYADKPVIYVNLEDDRRNRVKRSSKGSRSNAFSGKIVAFLASWASKYSQNIRIGVITPYRAQVGFIRKQLRETVDPSLLNRIKIGSIHSFQGDEADVVIFDIVDAPNEKLGLLYLEQTGERLINVAVSRAKSKLIVVGDIQNLHDGKGHTRVSTKVIKVSGDISRYKIHMEPKLKMFIEQL